MNVWLIEGGNMCVDERDLHMHNWFWQNLYTTDCDMHIIFTKKSWESMKLTTYIKKCVHSFIILSVLWVLGGVKGRERERERDSDKSR